MSESTSKHTMDSPPLWKVRLRLTWKSFKNNWAIFRENPIGSVGLAIIITFGLLAISHPFLMATVWEPRTYDPITGYDFEIFSHPSPPSWASQPDNPMHKFSFRHILGTDPLGRDVLSQLMFSTRSEFLLGVGAALVTVLIATTVGAVSAYYGGIVDILFMRMADVMMMLPFIAILIVLSSLFDFEMIHLAIVYGILAGFGGTTIVIKSQALTIKVKAYIEAARIAGGNDAHIIFTHLVPNLLQNIQWTLHLCGKCVCG
jgi:peptide/nickel transport system permease protein